MRYIKSVIVKLPVIALMCALVVGCAIKLAPEYDKAIVDGLKDNSKKVLVLFASISNGSLTEDYPGRKNTYDELIGAFESLKVMAEARPVPSSKVVEKANEYLKSRNKDEISLVAPSSGAINEVVRQLIAMRERDKSTNMSASIISAHKGFVLAALDQAITYESFLER
ncbi:hypothetical protein [Pseudomonas sp. 1928-m]|uniref:hypothetical protein n=1 Tax=Pseudomonas sp. 1928-m TaxID=3033804 RepID=UPI0023DEA60E|nr:hypothetical protein [Pseudomonas sp. 1928-m]MDF3196929.1 hypothetical protein [Pseudomonas sp. 1928-m]